MKVKNVSGRLRRLSAIGYVEWVLGDLWQKTSMQVITEIDPKTGAMFAGTHIIGTPPTGPRSLIRVRRPGP